MDRLVQGACVALARHGVASDDIEVLRVAGAFEVPQAAAAVARGRPEGIVALAVIVRGETPHFDYLCGETTRALLDLGVRSGVAIGFGVLTCDTMEQALARSGGDRGNKGAEAAEAAWDLAASLTRLRDADPR